MKTVQVKQRPLQRAGGSFAAQRAVWRQNGLEALQYAAAAFLLSGLGFFGAPLTIAACLIFCVELPLRSAAALLGACAGYALLWGWELAMEPVALSLSCFVGAALFRRTPVSRSALCAGLCAAVGGIFLLDSGVGLSSLLRLAVKTAAAALVPAALLRQGKPAAVRTQTALRGVTPPLALPPQEQVQRALQIMHGVLRREDPIVQPVRLAEVYDEAAERVCRCCVKHGLCWEQNAEDTYRDLCAAGELILARGEAQREDFPERFTERCCHTAGFLTAVNQALDRLLTRRREEHRREECRRVAAGQYLALERLLAALTRPLPDAAPVYAPELAVGSLAADGLHLEWVRSINVGCRRVTEKFLSRQDPPAASDVQEAHAFAGSNFAPYVPWAAAGVGAELAAGIPRGPQPERLIVTGGTVTTLVAIKKELVPYDSTQVHLAELTRAEILDLEAKLASLTVAQRAELAGIQAKRAPVILGGAVAVAELMAQTGFDRLTVSESDLLFGMSIVAAATLDGAESPVGWKPRMSQAA